MSFGTGSPKGNKKMTEKIGDWEKEEYEDSYYNSKTKETLVAENMGDGTIAIGYTKDGEGSYGKYIKYNFETSEDALSYIENLIKNKKRLNKLKKK